jgi:hypothetical protein
MNCLVSDRSLLLIFALGLASSCSPVLATQNASITWNPSPDPTTVGYYIYYGQSGQTATKVPAGQALRGDLSGLMDNTRYSFYVTAVNGAGEESGPSDVVTYTTAPAPGEVPNTPPLLDPIPDRTVNPGQVLIYQLSAVDFNADTLTYSLLSGPTGAHVDPQTGIFTWRVPKATTATEMEISVQVSDSGSPDLTDTKQFGLRVIPRTPMSGTPNVSATSNVGPSTETDSLIQPASLTRTVTWVGEPLASQPVRFELSVPSSAGPQYLEVSEDLATWTRLGLVTGPDEIVDATSVASHTRFYRVAPAADNQSAGL